jgi:hypothetical protein
MLHYIADHRLAEQADTTGYAHTYLKQIFVFYHFLRCLGWEWLWSCSHNGATSQDLPQYVADGDMEADNVTSWAVVGTATRVKDLTEKHMGSRSLKVISAASGDGVENVAVQLSNGYSDHYFVIWAANDSGDSWNVDLDIGGGYSTVGTIPDNGGTWTRYVFGPYTASAATGKVKVYDNNNTQGFIHLDTAFIFVDYFEFSYDQAGSDGDVQNGNEFSSTGYSFVVGDVNKTLCFFDPNNLGNSGAYRISGVSSGNAVLDLRQGGAETLINTSVGTLVWRLVDPINKGPYTNASVVFPALSAGFGLESPHSSKWRMFWRSRSFGGATPGKHFITWSGVDDFDFSSINGEPLGGLTTFTRFSETYDWGTTTAVTSNMYITGYTSVYQDPERFYAMVAGGGEFVAWFNRNEQGIASYPCGIIGYLSTDTEYDAEERFFHLCRQVYPGGSTAGDEGKFTSAAGFSSAGLAGTSEDRMVGATVIFPSTINNKMMDNTYNQANPYSGREWSAPATLASGHGNDANYAEMEMDVEGGALVVCNSGLTNWSTFDSHNYMNFRGLVGWKWMGRSVIS